MASDTTPIKLRIPGTEIPEPLPLLLPGSSGQITYKEVRTFRISASRAGGTETPVIESHSDDIVEVELEDGTRFWTSQERLRTEVLGLAGTRAADGVVELPATLDRRGASRGLIGKIVIKTLKFFKIDVAEKAASFIAEKLENHLLGTPQENRGPGLYRILAGDELKLTPVTETMVALPADKPSLLFLHGTASSTTGSFGKLWTDNRRTQREQLLTPYEGRVFGLEHETLSKSPIYNAIAVAEKLPPGARLHMVSHSRGGLVGELLCRSGAEGGNDPFNATDLAFFAQHNPEKVRGDLEHLNGLLREKRFRIERFARVACPARGTNLASERLDIYLSVLFNLLENFGFISKLTGGIFSNIFSELIMAVAKERCDPSVLPGIEAMIPSSPLVALLNQTRTPVSGELRVIAGDIEGDNVLSAIGTLLTDPLYQDDHDLVVNTDAMFGGSERSGGAAFIFRRGADVNHFSYFANQDSAEGLARTLSRGATESDGFEPFSVRSTDSGTPPYEKRDVADTLPVVFVLPGIMGSHLAIGDNRIWLNPLDIAAGKLNLLSYGTPNLVTAQEPLWLFYGDLVKHLATTHRVEPFPFDWRLSLFDEADRLAVAITKALDDTEKNKLPVSIVAHSMGGLVARAMIVDHPEVWERMKERPESKLIMLGTPNGGSHAVTQVLTGRDSLIRKLALLDATRDQRQLIAIVAQFPGLLEMLPTTTGGLDLFDAATWQTIAAADPEHGTWQPPTAAALAAAKAVGARVAQSPIDPQRMFYIAGCAPATPADLTIEGEGADQRLVFHGTAQGDGRVPWDTGIPDGLKTWYLPAAHGDLPACEEGFEAISDILRRGSTDRLPTSAPETRGPAERFELPAERAPLYPDFSDLARTALGAGRAKRKRHTERKIQVSIRHGNLAFASHPVLVGHYKGDTIISAEAYLDRTLDKRLTARHKFRLYPGDEDTAEVFLNPEWEQTQQNDGKPPGAIVIGLGAVGDLTPGRLLRAVSRGARSYSLSRAECPQVKSGKAGRAGISPLLVGTGAGGVPVADAVTAILRAIIDANRYIRESASPDCAPIEEVEFVELYEDRAIQAARTLARLRNDPEISREFSIEADPQVLPLAGGKRRASYIEEEPWWQRLQITEDKQERLSFNLLTDRARAEVYLLQSQRNLADRFIEEMSSSTASNEGVAITLFEMLVPNELKEYAPDRQDIVLVLNDKAARYPWEMMQERRRGDDGTQERKPLAVQAGMVRQLLVDKFRERVVTARDTTALVIGNPPTPFINLPAAEQEARKVEQALKNVGYGVTSLIGPDAKATFILKELFARDYRIIHLAGHGVFDYHPPLACDCCQKPGDGPAITGMVIGENQFLTAAQIRQMRSVPQLVFVNCCHLGKIDDKLAAGNRPPDLAANVATELIRMGVRCVVAAGWAVQDEAASLFAATFYREILSGSSFGCAVHAARSATYAAHPEANTWGAYQCYGDPDFTLAKGDPAPAVRKTRNSYTTPSEAIVDLENIAADAKTAQGPSIDANLKKIMAIEQNIPPGWLASGALQAALGQAYGEIKRFAEAVAHYRRAIADDNGLATIKTAEQLWNLQSRWALELAGTDRAQAVKLITEAEERLERLNKALGETGERLSLLGSVAKRRMMIAREVSAIRDALTTMAEQYHRAYELGVERGKPDFYPLVNQLAAQTLAYLLDENGELPVDFDDSVKKAIELTEQEHASRQNFWNTATLVDCFLLRHLAAGDLTDYTYDIIAGYSKAKNVGSPREFQSVLDQFDFLLQVIASAPESDRVKCLKASLEEIRDGAKNAGTAEDLRGVTVVSRIKATTPGAFSFKLNPDSVHYMYTHTTGFPIRLKRSAPPWGEQSASAEPEPEPELKPIPKRSGTLPDSGEELQPVQLGASAPSQVKPGAEFSARFVAYEKALEQEVRELLTALAPSARKVLGIQECRWKRDTPVTVRLSGTGLTVTPPEQTFIWQGGSSLLTFDLKVAANAEEGTITLKFDVVIAGTIVAWPRLDLEITKKPKKNELATTSGESAKTAFASYSSKDRLRVLDRVDAIEISAGIKVYQDCLDLHPGEEFKPRLDSEIRERDLFLLFWSKNASQSKWVKWELKTALQAKGEQALQLHPLDPDVKPPPGLKKLNIGSVAMWVRKGFEAAQASSNRTEG